MKVLCENSIALCDMPPKLIIAEDAVLGGGGCDTVGTADPTAQHHTTRDLHLQQHPKFNVMSIPVLGKSTHPYVQFAVQLCNLVGCAAQLPKCALRDVAY